MVFKILFKASVWCFILLLSFLMEVLFAFSRLSLCAIYFLFFLHYRSISNRIIKLGLLSGKSYFEGSAKGLILVSKSHKVKNVAKTVAVEQYRQTTKCICKLVLKTSKKTLNKIDEYYICIRNRTSLSLLVSLNFWRKR